MDNRALNVSELHFSAAEISSDECWRCVSVFVPVKSSGEIHGYGEPPSRQELLALAALIIQYYGVDAEA